MQINSDYINAKSAHLASHDVVENGLAAGQDGHSSGAAAQSSPANPAVADCEEPLVKIEVNSSPGVGDFNQQTAFSLPLDLNYPLLNATDIKSSLWTYSDFPDSVQKTTSSPSTSSEKSLPSFQDSTSYTAYTSMQGSTYSSNSASSGYPPTHGNGFYGNAVHSGYSTNISLGAPYTLEFRIDFAGTKHPTTSSYLSHYPTAFSSPQGSTSTSPQTAPSQSAAVYSSYTSFPATSPSQGFPQPGPLDYSPYGYGNYYYGSAASQSYPGSGYASALSQLTQGTPSTATPAYPAAITPTDLTYGMSGESSPPSPLMFKRNRSSKRSRKNNLPTHSISLSPEPEQPMDRVFIWDLDEAVVMLNALLNGKFTPNDRKDVGLTKQYATKLQHLMYFVADAHLHYRELEECDQVNVDDVSSDEQLALQQQDPNNSLIPLVGGLCLNGTRPAGIEWMRKLANRYQRIREVYKQYAGNVGELLNGSEGGVEEWLKLRQKLEDATDKWLTHAQMCIDLINRRSKCINVLVSSNQLVVTLSKVLIFGLGELFPIENVYSAHKISKESCFERVLTKFGKKCTYVVIGSSDDDERSCKALSIPFWPVARRSDLETLYYTLDVGHL
ncbi:eyes absent homolog 2 [Galendromus occidentalis]|uniref:Eyes absent homolog n=1 Tax=Galendromus occidentalis TaxID=34638 RepID=A0AAJ7SD74_9ACAR|nr:eyes absent homolog 2 [Galendromus occidentalis]